MLSQMLVNRALEGGQTFHKSMRELGSKVVQKLSYTSWRWTCVFVCFQ